MNVGIGSYTFPWSIGVPNYELPARPLDEYGLIDIAGREGLRLVQIADNLPLHPVDDAELVRLNEYARSRGIAIEVGTRGTEPDHLLRYLHIAGLLDSRLVRTIIQTADLEAVAQQLTAVLPRFAENNVTLAVENHGLHTSGQLASLFRRLNHPNLGCCLDTVNSFGALEGPELVIDSLIPFIVNLHLKDFDIRRVDHQMGFDIFGTPAGSGRLHIKSLIAKLQELGKTPSAIVELWTPYQGSVQETIRLEQQWCDASLVYLRDNGLLD